MAPEKNDPKENLFSPATILIVNQAVEEVEIWRNILGNAGYEVITAPGSRQGVAILGQALVDLLLVDIQAVGLDGVLELVEQSRKRKPDLAIVIVSPAETLETAIQAIRVGANGLLLKPFQDPAELVTIVAQALREEMDRREAARLHLIRPLIQGTETLFSETDLDALIEKVLDMFQEDLQCSHVGLYQVTQGGTMLEKIAGRGSPLPDGPITPDGGPVSRAEAWNAPVWVKPEQVADYPGLLEQMHSHQMACLMCAPTPRKPAIPSPQANGEGFAGLFSVSTGMSRPARSHFRRGVFLVGREPGVPAFTEVDHEMFVLLVQQAGVALENAALNAELRETIRELRASQKALIQAEKMAAIGRLTASIAHEINNPLQAMGNCLHLVSRKELSLEKRDHYLELAQSELERLKKTVAQMLDFYRPGKLTREWASIESILDGVLNLLDQSLKKQNILVRRTISPGLPPVFVVSNQIRQVFFNLLLNAMEAMPNGGEIMIRGEIFSSEAPNPPRIAVMIQDTGPGIAPEDREKIFEPFTSTKDQGTGLGLSISYNILVAHGGNLELVDMPRMDGEEQPPGACFRMVLPVAGTPG